MPTTRMTRKQGSGELARTYCVLFATLLGSGMLCRGEVPGSAPGRTISGRVLSEATDLPISNALVLASSSSTDMRSIKRSRPGVYESRTDGVGRFTLQIPPSRTISFNVLTPGYEEFAGQWMHGNSQALNIPFSTVEKDGFQIKLKPALYVAGVVVDEFNKPIPSVQVEATMRGQGGYGYVAFDESDDKGRFEIFDFPLKPQNFDGQINAQGQLNFDQPDKLRTRLRNIYAMPQAQQTNLQITLLKGHEIHGTVSSATGEVVPGLLVEAVPSDDSAARKSDRTDAQGQFVLRGVQGGVSLVAYSSELKQKVRRDVNVSGEDLQIALQLEPIAYKNPPKIVTLLGMQLANVTREVQETYDLFSPTGVVILDPGKGHRRLGIGDLAEGESFWIVGEQPIKNLKEMVDQILRINDIEPPGQPNEGCRGKVRIVYQYPRRAGTNTQYLTLNDADLQELRDLSATMQ